MGGGTVKTPEQIAAGLTEAQKRAMLGDFECVYAELDSLTVMGLLNEDPQSSGDAHFNLTPLGQSVCALLEPKP